VRDGGFRGGEIGRFPQGGAAEGFLELGIDALEKLIVEAALF
jgi:hypothetical protein